MTIASVVAAAAMAASPLSATTTTTTSASSSSAAATAAVSSAAAFMGERIAFVLCDAGETKALIPVIERVWSRGAGAKVHIIMMGTAATLIRTDHPEWLRFCTDLTLHFDATTPRITPLPQADIDDCVPHIREATLLVAGVAAEPERQFIEAAKAAKVRTIAYWDNMALEGSSDYFATAQKVAAAAATLFVPHAEMARQWRDREVVVVGQPAIDAAAQKVNTFAQKRIPADETRPRIMLVGGYGAEFDGALKALKEWIKDFGLADKFIWVLQPHPKMKAQYAAQAHEGVFAISPVSSEEQLAQADFVLHAGSTFAYVAFACGKLVARIDTEGRKDDLWPTISSSIKLGNFFTVSASGAKPQSLDLYERVGMPRNGAETCAAAIQAVISKGR